LITVNISDPTSPQIEGITGLGDVGPHGIEVAGSYAYVVSRGIPVDWISTCTVFDLSNPGSPQFVVEIPISSDPLDITISADFAYVVGVWNLLVIDISNPSLPQAIGSLVTPGEAQGVAHGSSYVYIADGEGGFHAVWQQCPNLSELDGQDEIADLGSEGPSYNLVFALKKNVPNPFNPMTRIRYDLPKSLPVRLRVYNVSGQLVRTLIGGDLIPAGSHETIWNGRDNSGRSVASGTYFYRLSAGDYVETRRMTLVR